MFPPSHPIMSMSQEERVRRLGGRNTDDTSSRRGRHGQLIEYRLHDLKASTRVAVLASLLSQILLDPILQASQSAFPKTLPLVFRKCPPASVATVHLPTSRHQSWLIPMPRHVSDRPRLTHLVRHGTIFGRFARLFWRARIIILTRALPERQSLGAIENLDN